MSFVIEKEWKVSGLNCIVIMTSMGHRCGYVGVDKTHPLYGVDYDEHNDVLKNQYGAKDLELGSKSIMTVFSYEKDKYSPSLCLDVHGGITYSDKMHNEIADDGLWYFGYDCAHAGDAKEIDMLSERMKEIELKYPTSGVIRTLEYCIEECERLANQLSVLDNTLYLETIK